MKDFIAHKKDGVDEIPLKHETMTCSDEKKKRHLGYLKLVGILWALKQT